MAVALTAASKDAFIGWDIGWSALDLTGISGRAMFVAAVYPLLLGTLAPATPRVAPWLAMAAGVALALLVGVSRVTVHAHSWSEVAAGLMLGGVVGVISLMCGHLTECRVKLWGPLSTAASLLMMPVHAPASNSHALVTRMALPRSGRHKPHTRDELRRKVPAIRNMSSASRSAVVGAGPLMAMLRLSSPRRAESGAAWGRPRAACATCRPGAEPAASPVCQRLSVRP